MSYDIRNDRKHSGLFVAAYNLTDVGPEDDGFGCVPGSPRSNYPFLDDPRPRHARYVGPGRQAASQ